MEQVPVQEARRACSLCRTAYRLRLAHPLWAGPQQGDEQQRGGDQGDVPVSAGEGAASKWSRPRAVLSSR
jgi:hypothetical protein